MKKKIIASVLLAIMVSMSGCSWICSNGPEVVTKLSTTVDVLKSLTAQLQLALLSGYDAEIELAYIAAKGSLAAAQTLLAQTCPEVDKVNAVVAAADKVTIPVGNVAFAKAKKLKLIK